MQSFGGIMLCLLLMGSPSFAWAQERARGSSGNAKDDSKGKLKGTLPANFGKLNLSDDQKQQIYRAKAKYSEKIDDLEKQIEKAKAERNEAYRSVLTKAQRDRLDEILRGPRTDPKDK
jgi:Spy/CpxP family protein refolding chaperone